MTENTILSLSLQKLPSQWTYTTAAEEDQAFTRAKLIRTRPTRADPRGSRTHQRKEDYSNRRKQTHRDVQQQPLEKKREDQERNVECLTENTVHDTCQV